MGLMEYFGSLDPIKLLGNLPGGIVQGLIWGIMALGVYITFRLLDFADLSVDGTFATGGAVTVMLLLAGVPAPLAVLIAVAAGIVAGCVTGLLHTLPVSYTHLVGAATGDKDGNFYLQHSTTLSSEAMISPST